MPRDEITTDGPSATRKPAILSAIHREAPALVVFSLVVLLSVPLFEGLARGDELIEELEEVRIVGCYVFGQASVRRFGAVGGGRLVLIYSNPEAQRSGRSMAYNFSVAQHTGFALRPRR